MGLDVCAPTRGIGKQPSLGHATPNVLHQVWEVQWFLESVGHEFHQRHMLLQVGLCSVHSPCIAATPTRFVPSTAANLSSPLVGFGWAPDRSSPVNFSPSTSPPPASGDNGSPNFCPGCFLGDLLACSNSAEALCPLSPPGTSSLIPLLFPDSGLLWSSIWLGGILAWRRAMANSIPRAGFLDSKWMPLSRSAKTNGLQVEIRDEEGD